MKVDNIFKTLLFFLSIVTYLIFGTQGVSAATIGKISGIVTAETTKQPLANANVSIVGTSTTTTTNDSGYYVINKHPTRWV